MSEFYHLKSIAELHRLFGLEKPLHPLITIIKEWPKIDFDFKDTKMTSDLYVIGLKGNVRGTFKYGRNSYDYEEGTLVFMAPNQVARFDDADAELDRNGWNIFFHPDLIRKSTLGNTIKDYSFFSYGLNEALHVSDKEKHMLTDFVQRIETELEQNIDKHSQELILVNLESILKYCSRYYDRQFYTRTNLNKDFIVRFEQYLEDYFASDDLVNKGIPNVTECGKALNMSGSYLSDLLKLETGRSAKDHIHSYIIEKAKTLLLNSNSSISEVSYCLGFEYSQHFSKLFKSKTGLTPIEFRNMN
ncbi:MAG: helix-turn-helix transcriptional regulator [Saprospirales bacterium]|nr:helix-turn-helix transcriptional regulator [Saprospirales bacterium]